MLGAISAHSQGGRHQLICPTNIGASVGQTLQVGGSRRAGVCRWAAVTANSISLLGTMGPTRLGVTQPLPDPRAHEPFAINTVGILYDYQFGT